MRARQMLRSLSSREAMLGAGLVLLFGLVAVRTAWMCDDAYITLRTVDHLVHGHGLVYNIGERVQSYTHPLWLFLQAPAYAMTREAYFTPIAISLVVTLVAVGLFVSATIRRPMAALFGVLAMVASRAFVDYSSSGLENPLSHLIVVLFLVLYLREGVGPRKLFSLSLLAALGTLNRLDLALVFLPALMRTLADLGAHRVGRRRSAILAVVSGFAPLLLWLLFSLLYYGFLFPNTAFAKLNTGIPRGLLVRQGLGYFLSSLDADPITLLVIGWGVFAAVVSRDRRNPAVALGVVLYLLYVVSIGGDFMNGRFFTVPFLCSLVVLCSSDIFLNLRASLAPVALVLLLGFASPHPPILSDANYGQPEQNVVDARGVADERAYYYPTTGLLQASRDTQLPRHPWAEMGRRARGDGTRVIVTDSLGMLGFYSGPDKWLVDVYGLVDPLLARQPIPDPLRWRVGHYVRDVPDGYEDTLKSGHNVIADPALARLYDQLALITRGRLLSGSRLEAIWKMHTRRSGD